MSKKRWTLKELYEQCPPVPCPEGCDSCCGPTPFSVEELRRVEHLLPPNAKIESVRRALPQMEGLPSLEGCLVAVKPVVQDGERVAACAFKKKGGGCEIYEDRPFVCRLYGTFAECENGLVSDPPLSKRQVDGMVNVYQKIVRREGR